MKWLKETPKEHEERYIAYLEKQLVYEKEQQKVSLGSKDNIEKLKYKLSKARLKLKVLNMGR